MTQLAKPVTTSVAKPVRAQAAHTAPTGGTGPTLHGLPLPPRLRQVTQTAAASSAEHGVLLDAKQRATAAALGGDMTRITQKMRAEWTLALEAAYTTLGAQEVGAPASTIALIDRDTQDPPSGPRASDAPPWARTPITIRALARATGLAPKVVRFMLTSMNWQIEEVAAPPALSLEWVTPDALDADYLSVDGVAKALAVSRSHVYATLRRHDNDVHAVVVGGMRFIPRSELGKFEKLPRTTQAALTKAKRTRKHKRTTT